MRMRNMLSLILDFNTRLGQVCMYLSLLCGNWVDTVVTMVALVSTYAQLFCIK